ncbi:MAG: ABC-2 type transport system permease protein [Mariniblastus sp.]|jgi:ABC-2 type transport system permease protein
MRAPETKMIMVFPFIMGMLACSFLVGKSDFNIPELLRPWIPIGVIGMIMFSITSMLFNQFGVDRDGFRAFMISPIRRRDILLGKNLAIVPIAFGLCGFLLVALQIFLPAGVLLFVGTLLQVPAIYLLYCMLGNVASIFFPMGIKRGSMQPANPRFIPMLILVLGSILGPSLLLVPTTIVCGVTTLAVVTLELSAGWIFLLLTAFQLVGTWYAYLWLLDLADGWLWDRGPKILDVVSNIPE